MESQKDKNILRKLLLEIGEAFLNLICGNLNSKVGIGLIFLIIGMAFTLLPIEGIGQKPLGLKMFGIAWLLLSLIFIFKRYRELRKESESKKDN